jgi:hypothetical protein
MAAQCVDIGFPQSYGHPRSGVGVKAWTKIVITVIAGGLTYLLTNMTGQSEIWQLTMSVFVGGITIVVQFLIDFDNRLRSVQDEQSAHAHRTERIVDHGFASINEATSLYGRVEATALRPDEITRLVGHVANIDPADALLHRFAEREIVRLSRLFKGFHDGNVSYEGEDRDWLLGLTDGARKTIDATSMTTLAATPRGFVDEGIWTTDLGQRYLDAQSMAIADHGVRIRRLFLLDDEAALDDPKTRDLIRQHHDIGVETRVLIPSKIPPLQRSSMFDFILFDDAVSYELSPASTLPGDTRPVIMNTTLITDERTVRDRIRRFTRLWEAAAASE